MGIGASIVTTLARSGWDVATTYWRPYDVSMPWGSDPDGRPFWTASAGVEVCPLHKCCRDQCEESLKKRQEALRRRTEVGTEQWLSEVAGS